MGVGPSAQTTAVVPPGWDHYHWQWKVGARLVECPGAAEDFLRQAWEDSAAGLPCLLKVSGRVQRRFLQKLPHPQKVVEHIRDDLFGQNRNSTRRVDEDEASSMSECGEVEDTGREQDTDTAPCMNLWARWKICATRQGLPCTAWF